MQCQHTNNQSCNESSQRLGQGVNSSCEFEQLDSTRVH